MVSPLGAPLKSIQQIPEYSSATISRPKLNVEHLSGATILTGYLASGKSPEDHIHDVFSCWKMTTKDASTAVAAEAITLARSMHLMILEQKSARKAIASTTAIEVTLRKL